ncbi:unnamed protein product [Mytilus edulis]|uniref:Uncharacterized protein n=1 Tax=Mytilus edulis TaxID=6550 RepID=A0A8S3PUE1_MYTED|nr:unnamed protein product [Mytilus edulis]
MIDTSGILNDGSADEELKKPTTERNSGNTSSPGKRHSQHVNIEEQLRNRISYKRLLQKMRYYDIRGHVLSCISAWLTQRNQRVCVDGEISEIKQSFRCTLGTVLGPKCFLHCTSTTGDSISPCTSLQLFADDSLSTTQRHASSCNKILRN